jgi:hypothetical protein
MESLKVLLASMALLLSGCAVTRYSAPPNPTNATLTVSTSFEAPSAGFVLAQAFENDKCETNKLGTRLAVFTTIAKGDPHDGKEIPIVADKEFVYSFAYQQGVGGLTPVNACMVTEAFRPEPGEKYRAHFRYLGRTCDAVLLRIAHHPDGSKRAIKVEGTRRVNPTCFDGLSG